MRPDRYRSRPLSHAPCQNGFGLVAALFVMIVIGGAIAAMMHLASVQHTTTNLSLQQARAYQAAKAGGEWGILHMSASESACAEVKILSVDGFNVEVTCSFMPSTELVEETNCQTESGIATCTSSSPVFYTITSRAENGSARNGDYAFRELKAVVERK
ncbi:pilus assembly protein MshP [Pseudomonas lopnurensis]|uniref:pilus assembly protein MshP n=1 Tax=Pseudomonas lopnurensis TaxID=1477517 RepID=UPI00187A3BEE|nr:pilus assembly protein MshP [Pseudomonas lopnurensis]MBE7374789.1 pilus assembly protein MshP [Pseudomonas lopnurensis]